MVDVRVDSWVKGWGLFVVGVWLFVFGVGLFVFEVGLLCKWWDYWASGGITGQVVGLLGKWWKYSVLGGRIIWVGMNLIA